MNETEEFFATRRVGADMEQFWRFMRREDSEPPRADDVMPDDLEFAEQLKELRLNPPNSAPVATESSL
jgi:hypothetical protein